MPGVFGNTVVTGAERRNSTAVYCNVKVSINAAVTGFAVCRSNNGASVYCDIAVGVDSVALLAKTAVNIQIASVYRGYGDIVFICIYTVITGVYIDIAAVYCKVQFGIKPFVFRFDIELSRTLCAAVYIHGAL